MFETKFNFTVMVGEGLTWVVYYRGDLTDLLLQHVLESNTTICVDNMWINSNTCKFTKKVTKGVYSASITLLSDDREILDIEENDIIIFMEKRHG